MGNVKLRAAEKRLEAMGIGTPATTAPERAKHLSYRQREMLRQAKDEWQRLPIGASCTNSTLNALEKRGLVETRVRYEPSRHVPGAEVSVWEWRKTPNARNQADPEAQP